jgi:hypothetical protein
MHKTVGVDELVDHIYSKDIPDINITSLKSAISGVGLKDYTPLVNEYNDYLERKSRGRIVEFPATVGDVVYHFCNELGRMLPYKISAIHIYSFTNHDYDILIDGSCVENGELLDDFSICLNIFQEEFYETENEAWKAFEGREK